MPAPKFNRASANCADHTLQVCFMETGLGNNQTITITASATATATYVCVTGSGRIPSAANKTTVVEDVSVSGNFNSGQNGQVSGCLFIPAPSPGTFSCPPGQHLVLQDLSFTDIEVTDNTNAVSITVPGTFDC